MLTIDFDSNIPLTDQVAAGLRRAIAEAVVAPGDELPPVRQLALDLGVNFNTVARAYRNLEASGLVRSSRGRGTRVVASVESPSNPPVTRVAETLRAALVDARLAGWSQTQVLDSVQEHLKSLWRAQIEEARP